MRALSFHVLRTAVVIGAGAVLGACGTVPMGTPQATIDNIRVARSAGLAKVTVGDFKPAPECEKSMDAFVGIRATTLTAPKGSFAGYLKETLETELAGAGLLGPAAGTRVEGVLTDRQVDASMNKGSARLAARFVVTRDGKTAFDREIAVTSTWESSFVGAVAIPAAINEFTALFPKLVGKLLSDPDFQAALKAS